MTSNDKFPSISLITVIGAVWGITMFAIGMVASFSLRSLDFDQETLGLLFGFMLILPISVWAFWKPKAAAIALVINFLAFECIVAVERGSPTAIQTLWRLGSPTAALAVGYLYLANHSSPE
jgi:hypothetical protein